MRSDDGVVVSITRFENNLAKYVKVMGKTIWEALQDEARLTAQAMIGATPPYGTSKKKSKDAKAVGAKVSDSCHACVASSYCPSIK